jgi:hypothetical protein
VKGPVTESQEKLINEETTTDKLEVVKGIKEETVSRA